MSRLIDADKLEPDTEWNDYDDDFVSYSQSQIRNAEEIQAIRLDKVKRAREEIKQLPITDTAIKLVTEILDKMIENEEMEDEE